MNFWDIFETKEKKESFISRKGVPLLKGNEEILIQTCDLVKEVNTCTSDFIRFYRIKSDEIRRELEGVVGEFLVAQEVHIDTKEIIVRILKKEEGDGFLKDRMECYSMMWGSCCGGKFDYYEVFQEIK